MLHALRLQSGFAGFERGFEVLVSGIEAVLAGDAGNEGGFHLTWSLEV